MKMFNPAKKWRISDTLANAAIVTVFGFVIGCGLFQFFNFQFNKLVNEYNETMIIFSGKINAYFTGRMMALEVAATDRSFKRRHIEGMRNELKELPEVLGVCGAAVYSEKGDFIVGTPNIPPTSLSDDNSLMMTLSGQRVVSNLQEDHKKPYVSFQIPMSLGRNNEKAILAADFSISTIKDLIEKDNPAQSGNFFIMDGHGKLLYHPSQSFMQNTDETNWREFREKAFAAKKGTIVAKSPFDGSNYLYVFTSIDYTDWRIVMPIPLKDVYWRVIWRSMPEWAVLILLLLLICSLVRIVKQRQAQQKSLEILRMERMSCVNQLAAGIAHEIRNPLTSIKGFVQLIGNKKEYGVPPKYLEIILSEIVRIDKLINEFRLLSRPVELLSIVGPVDVVSIIDDVVVLMQSQALAKNVVMSFKNKEKNCFVRGDVSQLKQVLINLIKNAIEAVDCGGKVDIILFPAGKEVILKIVDNGIGIPEETINKLGRPFFTTKENGTGLGLSLCFSIVSQHKGKLEVSSKEGQGTMFTVHLPRYQED